MQNNFHKMNFGASILDQCIFIISQCYMRIST